MSTMARFGGGLLWTWAGTAIAVFLLRWVDLTGPIPAVQALSPLIGLSLLVVVGGALALHRRALAGVAGAALLVMAATALPLVLGSSKPHEDGDLVILSSNLQFGGGSLADVEAAVDRLDVTVLVLLEVTPEAEAALDASTLSDRLPFRNGRSRTGPAGTMILTRHPQRPLADQPHLAFDQVAVEIDDPGGAWSLLAVHPLPPLLRESTHWRGDLDELTQWRARQDTDRLVIAGDFNASAAHPGFRELTAGMTDAHRAVGAGWVRTWPDGGLLGSGFVQIDHVVSRGVTTVDAGTVTVADTDHVAVWARLRIPPPLVATLPADG
ncbi:MAG: endonuclease/exonuclease/phosphatase family protein [Acidimicrobiales bacterium]